MWSYYHDAALRSFYAAVAWASAQGIVLTAVFAISELVCAILFAGVQALRRKHSWQNAKYDIKVALKDFFGAFLLIAAASIIGVFVIFFMKDAPNAINSLK